MNGALAIVIYIIIIELLISTTIIIHHTNSIIGEEYCQENNLGSVTGVYGVALTGINCQGRTRNLNCFIAICDKDKNGRW